MSRRVPPPGSRSGSRATSFRLSVPGDTMTIPRATYRLQFHGGFGFMDAARLAPYLSELGVSHVYASPYLSLSLAIFGAAEDTVQRYQPRMPLVVSAAEPS